MDCRQRRSGDRPYGPQGCLRRHRPQKFFHTPRISHIHLDRYGSYLWQQIDGQKDVGQLADDMREHFGETAEPLYDRLIQYMQTLRNHRFVSFQEKDRGSDV